MDSISAVVNLPTGMTPTERRALADRFPKKEPCSLAKFLAARHLEPHDDTGWRTKEIREELMAERTHQSPISEAKTRMRLLHGHVGRPGAPSAELPSAIQLDLNVPSYTVGNNVALGNSGLHAGNVALWAVSIELIRCGVRRDLVDTLTLADVEYYEATICFQWYRDCELAVEDDVRCVLDTARHLGLNIKGYVASELNDNWSAYVNLPTAVWFFYQKTNFEWTYIPKAEKPRFKDLALHILRGELRLSRKALVELGLTMPESWSRAHASGTYTALLTKFMEPLLAWPNGRKPRKILPKKSHRQKLSARADAYLTHHLAGGSLANWADSGTDSARIRKELLEIGIDARMSWRRQRDRIDIARLEKLLDHPGDNTIPEDVERKTFSRPNWSAIFEGLQKAYLEARPEVLTDADESQFNVIRGPKLTRRQGKQRT